MNERADHFEANPLALWYSILAGPAAFAFEEGLNYAFDQHACSTGHFYVQWIVCIVTFLIALSGAVVARMEISRTGEQNEDGGRPIDRSWFMARLGLAASLGFALVVVALTVPHFILSPCD
jgi:hypothetical protein